MFGIGGRNSATRPLGREAVCEALLGEYIRGMSTIGLPSISFEHTDQKLQAKFLAVGDPMLRSVTIGIDRPAGRRTTQTVLVTIAAEARFRCADPLLLAKLHKTALDHISSAPAERGVRLVGHWNSIIAYVEMDVDPNDFAFKGEVGANLIAQTLTGVISDLTASIKPYFHN